MFVSYRQLIALASAAIAIVALAMAVRISQFRVFDLVPPGIFSIHRSITLTPSSSFYSAQNTQPATGATETQSKMASLDQGVAQPAPAKQAQPVSPVTAAAYLVGDV